MAFRGRLPTCGWGGGGKQNWMIPVFEMFLEPKTEFQRLFSMGPGLKIGSDSFVGRGDRTHADYPAY